MSLRTRSLLRPLERRITPTTYFVTNAQDAGSGSLRQAVLDANAAGGADSIVFDAAVFATPQTITLKTGQMTITDAVTITGPTAKLTIDASHSTRIFEIDLPGKNTNALNLLGLTLINGNATTGGGAIATFDDALTLANVNVFGCASEDQGGAISSGASLTISDCVFSRNSATGTPSSRGGAILMLNGSALTVTRSTISGNMASASGGGIFMTYGTLTLTESTISDNRAGLTTIGFGFPGGGGMLLGWGPATIRNCTISGNTAPRGGGIYSLGNSNVTIQNSTIALNAAANSGGGIYRANGTVTLESVILAKNTAPSLANSGQFAANFCLLGETSTSITGSNNKIAADPLLGSLGNYGGPTPVHPLLPGSPAVDAGSNPTGLVTDQRGSGFSRVNNGFADIGAVEGPIAGPMAVAAITNVDVRNDPVIVFTITYYDQGAIDVASLGTGNVTVAGPNEVIITPTFVGVDDNSNGSPRVATYQFTAPGGIWDPTDNGVYTLAFVGEQVYDTDAPAPHAALPGAVANFSVSVGQTFVVDITTDENDGNTSPGDVSLREAIALATANSSMINSVVFDPLLFASPQTMILTLGELKINNWLFIDGPAAKLTIDANKQSRIFNIDVPGKSYQPVSLADLALINGKALTGYSAYYFLGGGIECSNEALTLTNVSIAHCQASGGGGGVYCGSGSVTIQNCILTDNIANSDTSGGAIFLDSPTQATITRSTIVGNTSGRGGGGIYFYGYYNTSLLLTECLIAENRANVDSFFEGGGGLFFRSGTATIQNCTFSGNTAASGGAIWSQSNSLVTQSCTIANNIAEEIAGGTYGYIAAESSLIGNNVAPVDPDASYRLTASYCLIGNPGSVPIIGEHNILNVDPLLGPLGSYGGPTLTHQLLLGSPALDAGSNPAKLTNDQRGPGFPRVAKSVPDIGAVEGLWPIPIPIADPPDIVAPSSSQNVTVKYTDDVGIDVTTLGTGDISVIGPNGFSTTPIFQSLDINNNGTPRVATYQFTPPGGVWDPTDNGTYTIVMTTNQVLDIDSPTPHAAAAGAFGDFAVAVPTVYVVDITADESDGNTASGDLSLREAIELANANGSVHDFINFDPAVFATAKTISLSLGEMEITEPVTITGPGSANSPPLLTIDANAASRIFEIDVVQNHRQDISISRFVLTNGNVAGDSGGAIKNYNESLSLTKVNINNCKTDRGGGAIDVGHPGTLSVTDCELTKNSAWSGGAISTYRADVIISFSLLSGNVATLFSSGAIGCNEGSLTITDSTFVGNQAAGNGGAIGSYTDNAVAIVRNCTFTNNSASNGGAISASSGYTGGFILENSTFSGNTAGLGGGLYLETFGQFSIVNTTISGNSAYQGGGIWSYGSGPLGPMTITNCIISSNQANLAEPDGRGGGIYFYRTTVNISRSQISSNNAYSGGGIWCFDNVLSIVGSTIDSNTSVGPGAGLASQGASPLKLDNSAITNNKTSPTSEIGKGGGLYLYFGYGSIQNCTISGNSSSSGGGLWLYYSNLALRNSTIASNTASSAGGGIHSSETKITLDSDIVGKNNSPMGPDIKGLITANYSLIGTTAGATITGTNNKLNVDPMLGPLTNNGGPTLTHALLPGSPAIDSGRNTTGVGYDQRGNGYFRVSGKSTDIGAFEVQSPIAPAQVATVTINDGSAQRSRITSLKIAFGQLVSFTEVPATAFELKRNGDNALVTLAAATDFSGNQTIVTLTFTGGPVQSSSLADGRYTLIINADQVFNGNGLIDGDANSTPGGNYILASTGTSGIFRLFGDGNGDARVDSTDFTLFRTVFGTSNGLYFDANNDGVVHSSDFVEFRKRFGIALI